jgi:hypothetical protein
MTVGHVGEGRGLQVRCAAACASTHRCRFLWAERQPVGSWPCRAGYSPRQASNLRADRTQPSVIPSKDGIHRSDVKLLRLRRTFVGSFGLNANRLFHGTAAPRIRPGRRVTFGVPKVTQRTAACERRPFGEAESPDLRGGRVELTSLPSVAAFRQPHEDRGRDIHCWTPPVQIRACAIHALGSHLGCLTANRVLGHG